MKLAVDIALFTLLALAAAKVALALTVGVHLP